MSYKTERGNVAKKGLRFHATAKIALDYQPVTKHPVAASRQLAPEVIIVMLMSPRGRPPPGLPLLHSMIYLSSLSSHLNRASGQSGQLPVA